MSEHFFISENECAVFRSAETLPADFETRPTKVRGISLRSFECHSVFSSYLHLGLRQSGLLGHLLPDERVRVVRLLEDVLQQFQLLGRKHGPVPPRGRRSRIRRSRPPPRRLLLV